MSRLSALKQKIEKLPQQNAAAESAALLIREKRNLEKIRTDFDFAVEYIRTLREYEELSVTAEYQKLTQFSKSVKTIKVQFEDFENFSKVIYRNWLEKNKDVPSQVISNLKLKSNKWLLSVSLGNKSEWNELIYLLKFHPKFNVFENFFAVGRLFENNNNNFLANQRKSSTSIILIKV